MLEVVAVIAVTGRILSAVLPEFGFAAAPFPLPMFARVALVSFQASGLLVSIHLWIAMRFSSIPLALGVGIFATVGALFIFGQDVSYYYPWTMPGMTVIDVGENLLAWAPLWLGSLGGLGVALLAARNLARQEVV